jgi:hypothetical protein
MKKSSVLLVGVVVAASLLATDSFARGGGRAGGGGARGGGFSGGARPAASPSFNRSPSMSRAAPASMNRPAQYPTAGRAAPSRPTQRPSAAPGQGPATHRPGQLPAARPGTGVPAVSGRAALQSPQNYQRPSQSQLSSFLDLPAGSARGQAATAAPPRPAQLPSSGGSFGKTVTGPHGGQVTVGGKGGSRIGPGGATVGAGRVGMKVTGPGGNTYTKVAGGAAIRGPGGNTVAAGRGASFVNGQFVGGRSWSAVNGNFTRWNCFTPGWYGRYPGAWWPGRWAVAATAWSTATWATAGGYCGCTGDGTYYDYGENVNYQDGTVYYGDQPVATAEQYYSQADEIAASGQQTQNEEWLPLGVFAVIAEPTQTQTDKVVQLAMNKEGVIRGNLQDSLTDKVVPVVGAVDKQTQRVALKLEGNDSVVVETGLYDLTNDEVPLLVHFGPDRQEARTLIRLKQPDDQGQQQ